jgi:hypothetical protein
VAAESVIDAELTMEPDLVRFYVAKRRQFAAMLLVGAILAGAGCAGVAIPGGASPEAKAAAVKQRAQSRWDALLNGDYAAAYTYLSQASRQLTTPEQLEKRHNRAIRAAKVEEASCRDQACEARIAITFDHKVAKGLETVVQESWIIADGQAWLVYRQ